MVPDPNRQMLRLAMDKKDLVKQVEFFAQNPSFSKQNREHFLEKLDFLLFDSGKEIVFALTWFVEGVSWFGRLFWSSMQKEREEIKRVRLKNKICFCIKVLLY